MNPALRKVISRGGPKVDLDFVNGVYRWMGIVCPTFEQFLAISGSTYSRASVGFYTDTGGFLHTWPSGKLRIGNRGAIVEPTEQQRYKNSSSTTGTSATNGSLASNTQVAPDGTTTADTFTASGTSANHCYQPTTNATTASTNYLQGGHFKAISGRYMQIRQNGGYVSGGAYCNFDLSGAGAKGTVTGTGALSAGIQALTNGWYRCWFVSTCGITIGTDNFPQISVVTSLAAGGAETNTLTDVLAFWGGDTLAGTASGYVPGSHIENGGTSTATRPADALSINLPSSGNNVILSYDDATVTRVNGQAQGLYAAPTSLTKYLQRLQVFDA